MGVTTSSAIVEHPVKVASGWIANMREGKPLDSKIT
jgi:hypothetical protein